MSKRKGSPDRSLYRQKYKCAWETELKWLKKGKTDFSAACSTCSSEFNVTKGGLKDLRRHADTEYHKKNQRGVEASSSMDSFVIKQNNDVVDAELQWANFVCENNLPVKLSDGFCKLVPKMFPDSNIAKNLHCSRTKTSQIIVQALGSTHQDNIVTSMRKSLFTLMIDESTDISVKRQMVIMARFFATDKVETHLYKVVALEGQATGQNLFNVVSDSFQADEIPWANCLSMSSDGARAMVGEFNSVLSRVRREQDNVWFLHCTCHIAHLAASHACSKLPDVCEQLSKDVYVYFKTSGKRQEEFKNIQNLLEVESHKILRPCFTRWLAMLQCIERLLEQWDALIVYFDAIVEGKESSSESVLRIKDTLHSDSAKLYFLFLQAVLPRFSKFNVMFQHERPYVHKLHSASISLLRQFIASFILFRIIQQNDITSVDFKRENQLPNSSLFIGFKTQTFLEEANISSDDKNAFFGHVRDFYVMGAKELYRLLPLHDEVLKNVAIFDPHQKSSGDGKKIEVLANRFPNIINGNERDLLNTEFMAYTLWEPPLSPLSPSLSDDIDVYWYKVSQQEENGQLCFPTLSKLAKAMLILPHSNAGVERVFSTLTLIKTAHRSSLESPMLNALMHCSSRKNLLEFKPTEEMRKKARSLKK